MPSREGLPGLDSSLQFSAEPLDHLFLVFNGAGDPYVDHQPWLSSLENCLTQLQNNYNLIVTDLEKMARRMPSQVELPSALFLPVEWHRSAFETWQSEVRVADPRPNLTGMTTVRDAVSDMMGDIIMVASPFWRRTIADHLSLQIQSQIAAVRRNRPAFSGRVSLVAHALGSILVTELLHRDLIPVSVDAVVFTGCPLPVYAVLAPDEQHSLATIRRLRSRIRFINVFHPFDPVAYRLEPFVFSDSEHVPPAVKVSPRRRSFWHDAELFWDDIVYNLWSSLFPRREGAASNRRVHVETDNDEVKNDEDESNNSDGANNVNGCDDGENSSDDINGSNDNGVNGVDNGDSADADVVCNERTRTGHSGVGNLFSSYGGNTHGRARLDSSSNRRKGALRHSSSYIVKSQNDGDECDQRDAAGGEVLLSGRIDYELQDGMAVPPLDVMASWGAIKAHSYYWQSLDLAQMLLDIVMTSDDAMATREA